MIYEFGEERHARRIARAIVAARGRGAIETTGQLADIVRRAVPRKGYSRIDPATRTFQAIRIWVNRELDGLDAFLARRGGAARAGRAAGGDHVPLARGPDREAHAAGAAGGGRARLTVRTKRPLVPADAEIERNPRARSAKLRGGGASTALSRLGRRRRTGTGGRT